MNLEPTCAASMHLLALHGQLGRPEKTNTDRGNETNTAIPPHCYTATPQPPHTPYAKLRTPHTTPPHTPPAQQRIETKLYVLTAEMRCEACEARSAQLVGEWATVSHRLWQRRSETSTARPGLLRKFRFNKEVFAQIGTSVTAHLTAPK
jgi:hypothetical protein